jgi:hypothetical protein
MFESIDYFNGGGREIKEIHGREKNRGRGLKATGDG